MGVDVVLWARYPCSFHTRGAPVDERRVLLKSRTPCGSAGFDEPPKGSGEASGAGLEERLDATGLTVEVAKTFWEVTLLLSCICIYLYKYMYICI